MIRRILAAAVDAAMSQGPTLAERTDEFFRSAPGAAILITPRRVSVTWIERSVPQNIEVVCDGIDAANRDRILSDALGLALRRIGDGEP